MRLVQLPGTKLWVNPEYVTSVREGPATPSKPDTAVTVVEYEGDAGYRTTTARIYAEVSAVVKLLAGEQK